MTAPLAPLTWAVCHELGMTAAQAAAARGRAVTSARSWAYANAKLWRCEPCPPRVALEDLPPIDPAEVRAIDCLHLWASVLAGEWLAAFSDPQSAIGLRDLRAARAWFGGKDFRIVCSLAGFDADAVFERFQARLGSAAVAA